MLISPNEGFILLIFLNCVSAFSKSCSLMYAFLTTAALQYDQVLFQGFPDTAEPSLSANHRFLIEALQGLISRGGTLAQYL